jgi:hypothetical protein
MTLCRIIRLKVREKKYCYFAHHYGKVAGENQPLKIYLKTSFNLFLLNFAKFFGKDIPKKIRNSLERILKKIQLSKPI